MNVVCCVTFHPLCRLTNYTIVGTVLGPALTVSMPATGLAVSQALFSPCHQHRSTEARSQDCSNHAAGPAVGTLEVSQTLAWPNLHMYVPTKPTAAKVRAAKAGAQPGGKGLRQQLTGSGKPGQAGGFGSKD